LYLLTKRLSRQTSHAQQDRDDCILLEIAESVLYVKQHSVSCIAAALFFVAVHLPATDEAFVGGFVQSLFEEQRDVPVQKSAGTSVPCIWNS
jgi:hypothetical protein